jgi:hypothetical protein
MKNLIKIFYTFLIISCCFYTTHAQTKDDKKAAKNAETAKMVNGKKFLFNANYVNPMRGGGRELTSPYDLTILKDTITAFLPYFGRAYSSNYGSTDNGIKFTWTHFDYVAKPGKKGGWDILISPKEGDKNIGDANSVQSVRLSISVDGYGSLQVMSTNRDPISFNGTVEKIPKKKGI